MCVNMSPQVHICCCRHTCSCREPPPLQVRTCSDFPVCFVLFLRPGRVEQPGVAAVSGRFDGTAAQQHVWLLMIAQQALNNPGGGGVRVKRDVKVASVITRFGFILAF